MKWYTVTAQSEWTASPISPLNVQVKEKWSADL